MKEELRDEFIRAIKQYAIQITEEDQDDLMHDIDYVLKNATEDQQLNFLHFFKDKVRHLIQEDRDKYKTRKRKFTQILLEFYLWLILGFILSFLFWGTEFGDNYSRFIFILMSVVLPFIFYLIFSKPPFAYLRDKYIFKKEDNDYISRVLSNSEKLVIQSLMSHYIQESKANSERLFSQSRTYLLLGCIIAISGVCVFFFLNDSESINNIKDLCQNNNSLFNILIWRFLSILPRFGVLFFIEYIAFFFLKQYRILMEEYRYYESIKRERQDLLTAYLSIKEIEDKKEASDLLLKFMDKHSAIVPQISGTHKLKTEKLVYDDLDLLSKITALIQAVKSNEKIK